MAGRDMHDAPLEERVAVEQRIWDRERDRTFADASMLQLTYPSYEAFFGAYPEYRYVREFFGPSVAGKRVLEVGCGAGVVSVALALSGARVTAVDVSASGLRVTQERARHYGVEDRVSTLQTPAERLDFPAGSFDLFLAKSVVHHLLIDEVMPLVYRFLAPGGRGAIVEPQGNPVLDFAREYLPYPGKVAEGEHGTDEFFTPATVRQILGHFDYGDSRAFRLVGMLQNLVGMRGTGYEARRQQEARIRRLRAIADPVDDLLFRLVPPLRRLAQLVVLRLGKHPQRA
jgi:2-polyprenyl-3-methyl-5-hydroxy-6-metoxy-1,4-benzoquinol methylase